MVLTCAALGCTHATQTASAAKTNPPGEEKPAPEKSEKSEKTEKTEKSEPEKAEKAEKPAKSAPVRDEMSTSRTTKAMFKPEGLKAMQRALAEKGPTVEATGLLDTQTQEALRAFQKTQTLPDTGLPDYETLRRLGLKPADVFQDSPPAERLGVP